ncbi:hypothetical protein ACP70R_026581 [Stipagrostis hirtigluma subsp. patula]
MKQLLPLLLLAVSLPCIAGDATDPVFDTDGHELSSDSVYHVLPAGRGTGGGLGAAPDKREPCRHFVAQEHNEDAAGIPVRFKLQNASAGGVVNLSTNVTITFHVVSVCMGTSHWYIMDTSEPRREYVAAGKRAGHIYIPPAVFRVERYIGGEVEGYKLVWCTGYEEPCKELGLDDSEEMKRLATSDSPLVVEFRKADPEMTLLDL